ncbi:RICIN domain-containing protein [Streptomyces sp. TRM 70361]|uniref:RICIN domain-containing protein n=1 Tax=Streptomyces sp. TRM 70361 TaxID=3116553 RepID=UPI002E7AAFDD|nr:RICIN domain-containing protein [Streptomyces sp. TRM 70361]MEE1939443.1 RICIN domain-containing protein [Streptomyces sp. TRM 70361]
MSTERFLDRRTVRRALVPGLATLALATAGATAVEATPRQEAGTFQARVQTFKNDATRRCLDDHGGPGNLRTFPCNNSRFQQWEVFDAGNRRILKNVATRRCLDDHGGPGNLRTFPCNNSRFQQWEVGRYRGGAIQLRSAATRRCLDDHGGLGNLRTFPCNWQHYQAWR